MVGALTWVQASELELPLNKALREAQLGYIPAPLRDPPDGAGEARGAGCPAQGRGQRTGTSAESTEPVSLADATPKMCDSEATQRTWPQARCPFALSLGPCELI